MQGGRVNTAEWAVLIGGIVAIGAVNWWFFWAGRPRGK
jgi:hypothetical protein